MIDCTFHHIGLACRDLERDSDALEPFGYVPERSDFEDPIQKVRGRFLIGGGPRLELLTPLTADSPVQRMLARGVKYYHQAYEVPDLDAALAQLARRRFKVTVPPVAAVAFDMRPIAFVVSPTLGLVELIQMGKRGQKK